MINSIINSLTYIKRVTISCNFMRTDQSLNKCGRIVKDFGQIII